MEDIRATEICVPKDRAKSVIEEIFKKGFSAGELSSDEIRRKLQMSNPDSDYTMISVIHPSNMKIEEVMEDILKRVL